MCPTAAQRALLLTSIFLYPGLYLANHLTTWNSTSRSSRYQKKKKNVSLFYAVADKHARGLLDVYRTFRIVDVLSGF